MRLCNFRAAAGEPLEAGMLLGSRVMPLATALGPGPLGPTRLHDAVDGSGQSRFGMGRAHPLGQVRMGPPLCPVPSFRDFYAFENHVKAARQRRGLEMVPEWYELPVFYFSNPAAMLGPDQPLVAPAHGEQLDFELELGCFIGREGRDIPVELAEEHIAGYTVLNDWSLRDLQRQEMKVGLGPAKGKDFATSIGPLLVTPDELEPHRAGKGYDLEMVARVNGKQVSRGNWKEIHFSFAQMIARASQGVTLRPGDLLGSGTVGTGCILELGPEATGGWLGPGDVVELEVQELGLLRTEIVAP
jgi:fumarylacetoacetate (FAA) hydrolase